MYEFKNEIGIGDKMLAEMVQYVFKFCLRDAA